MKFKRTEENRLMRIFNNLPPITSDLLAIRDTLVYTDEYAGKDDDEAIANRVRELIKDIDAFSIRFGEFLGEYT